jgi:hypothetical protein
LAGIGGGTKHVRGLPSLTEAREERRRALVVGKVRLRAMAPVFWLWTGLGLSVFFVVYWRWAVGELDGQKSAVMAKQRAVKKTLGVRLTPFVDQVERFVIDLGGTWTGNVIEETADWEAIGKRPGIYLRLPLEQSRTAENIRRGATASLHDGFTSCFFVREGGQNPAEGTHCLRSAECPTGMLCNEWDVCSPPLRPYNMRLAYRAWRILSTEFLDELRAATNDLEVRMRERDLDQVTRVDVPIAIDILQRSRYATIVLDEVPEGGVPAIEKDEPLETVEQRIQRVAHDARVGVWDLSTGKSVVRFRGRAEGRLVMMGDRRVVLSAETKAAQSRQANSCALSMELRAALASRAKSVVGGSGEGVGIAGSVIPSAPAVGVVVSPTMSSGRSEPSPQASVGGVSDASATGFNESGRGVGSTAPVASAR